MFVEAREAFDRKKSVRGGTAEKKEAAERQMDCNSMSSSSAHLLHSLIHSFNMGPALS